MTSYLVDRCPFCSRWIQRSTNDQLAALNAICGDISKQRDWPRGSGQMLDGGRWKRLIVAAWERAQGNLVDFYPAIDGEGFDIVFRRTSRLSKQETSDLIEFARAWAANEGVTLREPKKRLEEAPPAECPF